MRGVMDASFGEHLTELRKYHFLSIEDVAILMGVPSSVVDEYEKDIVIPKRKAIHEIAKAIGCDACGLLRRREVELLKRQGHIR